MTQIVTLNVKPRLLNELDFMDLYVRLDGDAHPHYSISQTGSHGGNLDLPDVFLSDADGLADDLRGSLTENEMSLDYNGMRLRATRLETAKGQVWAALRRQPPRPLELEKIGFAPQLLPILQDMGRRSGLILICGASSNGKTTTLSSLLTRYLEINGGVGFTLEDPVEYDLEGRIGSEGYCYQTLIKEENQWGAMLKRALRWHPRYIAVGEVRTPDAANQMLRAATSGHTVLATMHAGSMEEALEGLLQLAEQDLGPRAPSLLASGLIGVLHQTFTPGGLHASFMMTEADNPGSPVRSVIRERRIGMSRSFADQQMARLMQQGRIF